jgi:hypothetical protein
MYRVNERISPPLDSLEKPKSAEDSTPRDNSKFELEPRLEEP